MERTRKLRGRKIWIKEDKTFKERKIEWKLRRIAKKEGKKEKKIRIKKKRIWIENR